MYKRDEHFKEDPSSEMGSSTDQLRLPKVDFSRFNPSSSGTDEWITVRASVLSAIEAYGCFEVVYDRITQDLLDALFGKDMKELFDRPSEIKVKNKSDMPYHGYVSIPGKAYESLNIDSATDKEEVDNFAGVMWSEGNPSFCNTVLEYSKHASELDQMVRKMVLESLNLEKYIHEYIDSTTYNLRLSEYGSLQADEPSQIALNSHSDVTILSIVCQHGVEGLQVQTKDDRRLSPSPNSLTVIVGESFWAWSNGRYEPARHRVSMAPPNNGTRYSAIFGSRPMDGYMVQAPEELVDEEHPLQFEPYYYKDYVRFCYSQAGLKSECALRTYCGVGGAGNSDRRTKGAAASLVIF